ARKSAARCTACIWPGSSRTGAPWAISATWARLRLRPSRVIGCMSVAPHHALLFEFDPQGGGELAARHFELLLGAQVLHRHHAARGLVLAVKRDEADAGLVGVLELLGQFFRFHLDFRVDAGGAQLPG